MTAVAPSPTTTGHEPAAHDARSEMLEDYSLRYAPTTYRKWSSFAVANTALGGIAYLADFAIGGSLVVTFGFTNALFAILLAATVIFLTSFPIAYYSAKYSIDMDLITRGAGFGYFGGSVTSLIYASFTFIFFALEGSIMAQGLNLGLGLPLWLGYFVSALMIPPLVIFGMTLLSKMQMWTQPLWLVGMFLPFIVIAVQDPDAYSRWTHYGGVDGVGFTFVALGAGAGIALSLIAQIGEQVDYLRFMPAKTKENARGWWIGGDRRRPRLGDPRRAQAARRRVPGVLRDRGGRREQGGPAGRAVPGRLRRVRRRTASRWRSPSASSCSAR